MNRKLQSTYRAALLGGLALVASACSGARSHVVAPTSNYPVSLSDGVRDKDGTLLADQRKKVVGGFAYDYKAWGMFWRIISFTGDKDISDAVNQQVKAANGDAIVNLAIKSENCTWNIFTLIGLLPDCATVRVHGHIIRAEPEAAAAPKPAPAAAPASMLLPPAKEVAARAD